MSSFQQRLVEAMRMNNISNAPQLAKALGYSGSERVRLVLNGTSKPSFAMLEDLARVFASLNLHWLITGVGSKELEARTTIAKNHEFVTRGEISALLERITSIEATQKGEAQRHRRKAG